MGAIGEADCRLMTAWLTGRRCCPLGPAAEATAPKLIVAASDDPAHNVELITARLAGDQSTHRHRNEHDNRPRRHVGSLG